MYPQSLVEDFYHRDHREGESRERRDKKINKLNGLAIEPHQL